MTRKSLLNQLKIWAFVANTDEMIGPTRRLNRVVFHVCTLNLIEPSIRRPLICVVRGQLFVAHLVTALLFFCCLDLQFEVVTYIPPFIRSVTRSQSVYSLQMYCLSSVVAEGYLVGLVIQCLNLGRSSIPTPRDYSAAIPLGKRFTVHYTAHT